MGEKKTAVGDCIDSWQRFLQLHAAVKSWCEEKEEFVNQSLTFNNLSGAKLKLQDYQAAMKSAKNATKNIDDMNREFKRISQVSSTGDLGDKLNQIESEKSSVESQLMEKVSGEIFSL